MACGSKLSVRMRALVTVQPVWYLSEWNTASTVRPALVVVPRMAARNNSQVRSGVPAQLPLMKLKSLCSTGFHFAASCWVVAHGDLKSQPIAQHGLEALLPESCPIAVAATGVGQDQQLLGRRKGLQSLVFPPAGNRIDGESWRVGRVANVDRTAVIEHVIDAIRHGPPQAVAQEVMDVDGDRLEAPGLARLLEVADQLLFLTVDADNGLPCRFEDADLLVDVGELDIAVRVVRASFELLAVEVQRIVQLAQQAANRGWAERVASLFQAVAQRPQAAAHPFLGAHRIAGCFRSDQRLQHGNDQRCFFPPVGGRHLAGEFGRSAARRAR